MFSVLISKKATCCCLKSPPPLLVEMKCIVGIRGHTAARPRGPTACSRCCATAVHSIRMPFPAPRPNRSWEGRPQQRGVPESPDMGHAEHHAGLGEQPQEVRPCPQGQRPTGHLGHPHPPSRRLPAFSCKAPGGLIQPMVPPDHPLRVMQVEEEYSKLRGPRYPGLLDSHVWPMYQKYKQEMEANGVEVGKALSSMRPDPEPSPSPWRPFGKPRNPSSSLTASPSCFGPQRPFYSSNLSLQVSFLLIQQSARLPVSCPPASWQEPF